ncbi:phosphate acyltransferase PlsX [Notoacmeibacter ruber]|uniref:Phosphate acyltransferase n=1 Tax=Notoacmeibacter ruber TaxID=2670375 RepID=A0A3L7JA39_9HYPH|nr:phosphate acyltransferase PlsX [Notoacmeibacter ruber]RLQ87319.1 phosphate acyltransferase PlsX [Notoacmeibacter ruber]
MTTIAIDAMGGDHGPGTILPGLEILLGARSDLSFRLYGDEAKVEAVIADLPRLKRASTVHHTDVAVAMDEKPSQALRSGRYKSSMWQAIEATKTHEADVAVSAGNTGALMAMATFCLRTMANIDRPAIGAIWPTLKGEAIVLDVGATIGADAVQLVDFAILGAAMARALFGKECPTVGLLNVGTEDIKGQEEVKEAGRILRERRLSTFHYSGFVEGTDIGQGVTDVVVTEGFAGNIALKTAEGTAKQLGSYLREAMQSSMMSKIGYLFARDAFRQLREKMDPARANGGVFLGLNGLVVKSHGGADAEAFSAAVALAADLAKGNLQHRIHDDLDRFHADRIPAPGDEDTEASSFARERSQTPEPSPKGQTGKKK